MNIRKNIDYSEMFGKLDRIMTAVMPQMELYCEIGKAVCMRTEKGAAVAAAEYLSKHYPDVQGFSPRNLRRMRDFYRTYEDHPALLASAMQVGWTQNVVIMEADLPMELRGWYLKAAKQFIWSKAVLTQKIACNAHEEINLTIDNEVCYVEKQGNKIIPGGDYATVKIIKLIQRLIRRYRCQWSMMEVNQLWPNMSFLIFMEKRIAFMRC